jgi:hypothetical protein
VVRASEVVTIYTITLQMAQTRRHSKCETDIVLYIGCDSLRLCISVIGLFVAQYPLSSSIYSETLASQGLAIFAVASLKHTTLVRVSLDRAKHIFWVQ